MSKKSASKSDVTAQEVKIEDVKVVEEIKIEEKQEIVKEINSTVNSVAITTKVLKPRVLSQSVLVEIYANAEEHMKDPSKFRCQVIDPTEYKVIGHACNKYRFLIFTHRKWSLGQYKRGETLYKAPEIGDSWLVDVLQQGNSIFAVPVELADKSIKK